MPLPSLCCAIVIGPWELVAGSAISQWFWLLGSGWWVALPSPGSGGWEPLGQRLCWWAWSCPKPVGGMLSDWGVVGGQRTRGGFGEVSWNRSRRLTEAECFALAGGLFFLSLHKNGKEAL